MGKKLSGYFGARNFRRLAAAAMIGMGAMGVASTASAFTESVASETAMHEEPSTGSQSHQESEDISPALRFNASSPQAPARPGQQTAVQPQDNTSGLAIGGVIGATAVVTIAVALGVDKLRNGKRYM